VQTTDIIPVGNIQAIPRKESPYDSECIVASTATTLPASIKLFQNYTSFQVTPTTTTKQADRDTNLSGAVGALPQGSTGARLAA
jgi:cytochrome c556